MHEAKLAVASSARRSGRRFLWSRLKQAMSPLSAGLLPEARTSRLRLGSSFANLHIMPLTDPLQNPADNPNDPLAKGLLAAACLLGALVFVRLGDWSLWIDEAFALSDSLFRWTKSNPLGYMLFEAYFNLLGAADGVRPDELTMRLLPAILGWLGIPLTYWAFRPAVGRRVAAGAALILAASAWHLYWSQNARFYTLVQDLVLIASGLALRGFWTNRAILVSAGLIGFGVASLAHPTAALVGGGLFVAPFLVSLFKVSMPGMSGPPRKALLAFGIVGAVGFLLWAPQVWEAWNGDDAKGQGNPVHLVLTLGFFITPVLGVAALFGIYQSWRNKNVFGLFAANVVFASVATAMIASIFARVSAQYLFGVLPWIAVLAALPLGWKVKSGERAPASQVRMAFGILAIVVFSGVTREVLYLTVRMGERPQWREAYRYVWNNRGPGDHVFGMAGPVAEYYLEPRKLEVRDVRAVTYLNKFNASEAGHWDRVDRASWFVFNAEELFDWPAEDRREFNEMLREDCRHVKSWPLFVESRDLSVEVYVRD
jgi:mannosyltransferase